VAIIGILAAVAIPQYKNYTIKAKVGNALSAVDSLKTAVALCVQETGTRTGCSAGSSGIPANSAFTPTKEMASVTVSDGVIAGTLQDGVGVGSGKTITWQANPGESAVTWGISTTVDATAYPSVYDAITKNSAS